MLRMRLAAGIEEPAFQNNVLQGSKWASITCIVVSAPVIGRCSLTGSTDQVPLWPASMCPSIWNIQALA